MNILHISTLFEASFPISLNRFIRELFLIQLGHSNFRTGPKNSVGKALHVTVETLVIGRK